MMLTSPTQRDIGRPDLAPEWRIADRPVDYPDALEGMETRATAIRDGTAPDLIWMLEHPPLYTAGTSADEADVLNAAFPVHQTGRGGQMTYHGPGQRVVYPILDLKRRKPDVRWYVQALEQWIIDALAEFNIRGERREGRVGIWIDMSHYGERAGYEAKIAAIGVRMRKWVTLHGLAINVEPDLAHFDGIVPCGIRDHGVTSMVALGHAVTMADLDAALIKTYSPIFTEPFI